MQEESDAGSRAFGGGKGVAGLECFFYFQKGYCKWGDSCKYSHVPTGHIAEEPRQDCYGTVAGSNARRRDRVYTQWQGLHSPQIYRTVSDPDNAPPDPTHDIEEGNAGGSSENSYQGYLIKGNGQKVTDSTQRIYNLRPPDSSGSKTLHYRNRECMNSRCSRRRSASPAHTKPDKHYYKLPDDLQHPYCRDQDHRFAGIASGVQAIGSMRNRADADSAQHSGPFLPIHESGSQPSAEAKDHISPQNRMIMDARHSNEAIESEAERPRASHHIMDDEAGNMGRLNGETEPMTLDAHEYKYSKTEFGRENTNAATDTTDGINHSAWTGIKTNALFHYVHNSSRQHQAYDLIENATHMSQELTNAVGWLKGAAIAAQQFQLLLVQAQDSPIAAPFSNATAQKMTDMTEDITSSLYSLAAKTEIWKADLERKSEAELQNRVTL